MPWPKAVGEDRLSANTNRPARASMRPAAQPSYRIELSLSVSDAAALWCAALARGMAAPGASRDDLVDVIGPAEDPDLAACLIMLAVPAEMPGCALHDVELVAFDAPPARAAANDLALRRRARA
jgi:hypothetical protein